MDKKYSKEEIFEEICKILEEEFEIDKSKLKLNADLFQDLELDSIDAVDMAVRLHQYIGKRLSPDVFKSLRTLNDVVEAIYSLI